jgi:hypothetical protein
MPMIGNTIAASTAVVALMFAAGCASKPIQTDRLALAQQAIERAERAGAVELAPVEIRNARDKLAAAQRAAEAREAAPTVRLAEQAEVDAQLAEATARAEKSARTVAELDESLRALQRETQRPQGAK